MAFKRFVVNLLTSLSYTIPDPSRHSRDEKQSQNSKCYYLRMGYRDNRKVRRLLKREILVSKINPLDNGAGSWWCCLRTAPWNKKLCKLYWQGMWFIFKLCITQSVEPFSHLDDLKKINTCPTEWDTPFPNVFFMNFKCAQIIPSPLHTKKCN